MKFSFIVHSPHYTIRGSEHVVSLRSPNPQPAYACKMGYLLESYTHLVSSVFTVTVQCLPLRFSKLSVGQVKNFPQHIFEFAFYRCILLFWRLPETKLELLGKCSIITI